MQIKNFLPYGLVDYLSPYFVLRRLGFSKGKALKLSLSSKAAAYLRFTRLDLLPQGILKHLDYIVDVGANRGDWSKDFLFFINPKKLIAIEPSPKFNGYLKSCLENYDNVTISDVAVGDKPGKTTLNITSHSHNTSLLPPKTETMNQLCGDQSWNVEQQIEVEVDTLDNLLADLPEISLLKIDVQGYEKMVLEGSKNILKKTKIVMLEIAFISHYEGDSPWSVLHEMMNELGFSLVNLKVCSAPKSQAITWGDAIYIANSFLENI